MAVIAHIEDNLTDHALLREMLSEHQIYYYTDLDAFFKERSAFDLIITDLRLPKSYGYETVELIREYYPATPLLALTGMGGPYMTGDIIQTLMNKGADNVVSKDILCDSRMLAIVSELLS